MLIELTTDNLAEIVAQHPKVYVQYSAEWCGNCKIMKPKFKRFAAEKEEAVFVLVDAENNPESRKLANVDNLPTFAIFENNAFKAQIQTNKAEVLKDFIDETTSN